jgi:hypothetical protein
MSSSPPPPHPPSLLPHLLDRVRNIKRRDLLVILELEELVAPVARHVDEDVARRVCEEALAGRGGVLSYSARAYKRNLPPSLGGACYSSDTRVQGSIVTKRRKPSVGV